MGALLRDVRYAARALRASAGFSIAAVLTIAVGVGATAAIFSIVNAVLLRPLPFPDSDRLVAVGAVRRDAPGRLRTASLEELRDWQRQSQTVAVFAGWRDWGMTRHDGANMESAYGAIVTPELFQVLPATPVLGRLFRPEDDRPGHNRLILLAHDYWRQRFGSDAGVVGKTMVLEREDKATYTIIGVLPREFGQLPSFEDMKVFALSSIDPDAATGRDLRNRQVFGRLRAGVSIKEARAEMHVIAARLGRQYPDTNGQWDASLEPLIDHEVGPMADTLRAFFAAVGFVLLIACANVAALQLARAMARRREFSIRKALGGSQLAVVRALVVESALLSLIGGVCGLIGARWLVDLVLAAGPAIPRIDALQFDAVVFAFAFGVCIAAGLMLAVPASVLIARLDPAQTLKEESGHVANAPALRARMAFVGGQLALAVMLLAGAVVAGQTFVGQLTLRPGFDPAGVASLQMSVPLDKYPQGPQVAALYARLLEEIRAVPGVRAASAVSAVPLSGEGAEPIEFTTEEHASGATPVTANSFNVAPGYFRTLNAPLRRGRDFTADDTAGAPGVAIVNETFVRRYLPAGSDPLGAHIRLAGSGDVLNIVGVAGDVLQEFKPRAVAEAEIYWPYTQRPRWAAFLVVRGDGSADVMTAARARMRAVDADLRAGPPQILSERIARSSRGPRFLLLLFGLFAGVAALLSGIGVYGLVSYTFAQRTREIGVRISLGAGPVQVFRLVAASGFTAVMTGSVVGLLSTLALTRLVGSALPQMEPLRPVAVLIAWVLLVVLGWVACYLPARRALRIDPVNALRLP